MRLAFISMHIRDFKSFRGEHQLNLDLPAGLHRVRGRNDVEPRLGSNGSGKSTLWDALCWCLSGRTPGGLKNPDVKPWGGVDKGTRVVLIIEKGKRRAVIARAISPNSLTIDGKEASQEAVDQLIGLSFDALTNTIILGQARPLFFDLSPRDKLGLISDVKQLDRWDARSKVAADKTRALEDEQNKITGELSGYEAALVQLKAALADTERRGIDWQKQYDDNADDLAKWIDANAGKLAALQKRVDQADLRYDGCATEAKALERQLAGLNKDLQNARLSLQLAETGQAQLIANIAALEKQADRLTKAKSCPTCGQAVVPADLGKHRKEIARLIAEAKGKLDSVKLGTKEAAVAAAQKQVKQAEGYLQGYRDRAEAAVAELNVIKPDYIVLKEKMAANERLRRTYEGAANPYNSQARELRKRVKALAADHATAADDLAQCTKELERSKFWIKGFKDIKLHVIEEFLQELELTTIGMLEEIGLIGWRIHFAIERETKAGTMQRGLSVSIASPKSKGLVRWESWSGGEGQRLRLVGALALSSVLLAHAGLSPNIEILDEPTQHLSDEGIFDLCSTLADRGKGLTIFYSDHVSVDSALFASSILVRRDKEGSRLIRSGGADARPA